MHVYTYNSCFPLNVKLSMGFNSCRYRGGRLRSSAYCWANKLVGVHHSRFCTDYVNVNVQFLYMYI